MGSSARETMIPAIKRVTSLAGGDGSGLTQRVLSPWREAASI
jgi:hypothetical protein